MQRRVGMAAGAFMFQPGPFGVAFQNHALDGELEFRNAFFQHGDDRGGFWLWHRWQGIQIDENFQPAGIGAPPWQIEPPTLELLLHRIRCHAASVRQNADGNPFFRHGATMTDRQRRGKHWVRIWRAQCWLRWGAGLDGGLASVAGALPRQSCLVQIGGRKMQRGAGIGLGGPLLVQQ